MKTTKTQKIREYLANGWPEGVLCEDIAQKFKVSKTHVYTVYRQMRGPRRATKAASGPVTSICFQLQSEDSRVELKVRNAQGTLLGTLEATANGIGFRRPNQKVTSAQILSYSALDKIMQLGLV